MIFIQMCLSMKYDWKNRGGVVVFLLVLFCSCHRESGSCPDFIEAGQEWQARSMYQKGRVNYDLNQVAEAAHCYLQALDIAEKTTDNSLKGLLYNELGTLYFFSDLDEQSLHMQQLAYRYYEMNADSAYYPFVLRDIARAFEYTGQLDSSQSYYQRGLALAHSVNPDALRSIWSELGIVYSKLQNYEEAIACVNKSIRLETDTTELYIKYYILGDVYLNMKKYDSAFYYLKKGSYSSNIRTKADSFERLSVLMKNRQEYKKSLFFKELSASYIDSIRNKEKRDGILQVQFMFNEMKLKKEKDALAMSKLKSEMLHTSFLLVALLLVLVLFIYYLSYKRRMSERLNGLMHDYLENGKRVQSYKADLENLQRQLSDSEKRIIEYQNKSSWLQNQDVTELVNKKNKLAECQLKHLSLFKEIKLSGKSKFVLEDSDWQELMDILNVLYDDFVIRFQRAYPLQTMDAVHFCCLLKIGLNTTTIANLFHVNKETVYKRKFRIKKDLMPEGEGRTLDDFLRDF